MFKHLLLAAILAPAAAAIAVPPTTRDVPRETRSDTWTAVDGLGRALPTHVDVGPPRPGKFVGIFYFAWLGQHGNGKIYDLSRILAGDPERPAYGPVGAFHWWGQPHLGYYRSDDRWVIRRHAQQLADAGVDVIVIDATNAFTYEKVVRTIGDVFTEVRAAGGATPQIAFITNAHHVEAIRLLYDNLYAKGLYRELWFEWRGKPLIMANPEGVRDDIRAFFTFRHSWAFTDERHRKMWMGDGREKWPWIDNYPQGYGWRDDPGRAEQVPVAVATHPTARVGRSHDGTRQPPPDQRRTAEGVYFAKQWERALALDPQFVFVTGWNEWVAQRFLWGKPHQVDWIGERRGGDGDSYFVDQLDEEFSRDIEPMRGGFGDSFYYQLVANVRRFKGATPPPSAGPARPIAIDGDFAQWDDVAYRYLDDVGDAGHRRHPSFDRAHELVETSGRNDIESVAVAWDETHVHFHVRCVTDIRQPDGETRLWLLIARDGRQGEGWNGFDLIVNRTAGVAGEASVERLDATFATTPVATARYRQAGRELHLSLPRSLLEGAGAPKFDFKWVDHLPERPTPMDFIDKGDAAPNGRFRYRFDGAPQ